MPDALTLNMRGGSRIRVPADLDQAATYVLLEQEDWFEDEIRFLRRWLRPGMQAADIGANYGLYTASMAQSIGPGGKIWAFEPTPDALGLLRQSLQLNGFTQVHLSPAAVSDHGGTAPLGIGSHSELNKVVGPDSVGGAVLQVPAVTLDEIVTRHDWSRLDLVKIDVEGHELQVIAGGARFFAEHSPLVMLEVLSGGRFSAGVIAELEAMGYQVFRLIPGLNVLAPVDHQELDSFHLNLFACKRAMAEKLAAQDMLSFTDAASRSRPDPQAWTHFATAAPYASKFGKRWSRPGFLSFGGRRAYYDGLASYAESRAPERTPRERLGWLRRAFERVCLSVEEDPNVPRLMSYARLAAELGLREAAMAGFREAAKGLAGQRQSRSAAAEPFLAPSVRYEKVTGDATFQDWAECSVAEHLEKARAFSSLYGGETTEQVLQPALEKPFRSPETERRRQLVRMRTGKQRGPEAHALLCTTSEENLNPGYWCLKPTPG